MRHLPGIENILLEHFIQQALYTVIFIYRRYVCDNTVILLLSLGYICFTVYNVDIHNTWCFRQLNTHGVEYIGCMNIALWIPWRISTTSIFVQYDLTLCGTTIIY